MQSNQNPGYAPGLSLCLTIHIYPNLEFSKYPMPILCHATVGQASSASYLDDYSSLFVSLPPDSAFIVKGHFFSKPPVMPLTCLTFFQGFLRTRIWLAFIIIMCSLLLAHPCSDTRRVRLVFVCDSSTSILLHSHLSPWNTLSWGHT